MDEDRDLFGEVDDLKDTLNEMYDYIRGLDSNNQGSKNQTEQEKLDAFLKRSYKEYLWDGSKKAYIKSRNRVLGIAASLIIVMLLAALFTSLAYGGVTIFTALECVWFVFMIILMVYMADFKKKMPDIDIMDKTAYNFYLDSNSTWTTIFTEKRRFLITRWLFYALALINILFVWSEGGSFLPTIATMLELAGIALTVSFKIYYSNLIKKYFRFIVFTGENNDGVKTRLIGDLLTKTLYTVKDFSEKYPKEILQY